MRLVDGMDWERLVPIGQAANLLGMHPDALSKLCRDKLEKQGLAVFARPREGGQHKWFVYRWYHPALRSPAQQALYTRPDLSEFTGKQRDTALQRAACVDALRGVKCNGKGAIGPAVDALVDQLRERFPALKISRSQLYAWDKKYRWPKDLANLVDTRGGDHRSIVSPQAWATFADLYLHENKPSVWWCWEQTQAFCEGNGLNWCSYSVCTRQLNQRIPPAVQAFHRSPAEHRQQLLPTIQPRTEAWEAGRCWIGDHKQLDLWCTFGGQVIRPWLTAWMDWRTRRVCGWVLSDNPNSSTILAALRHGLMDPKSMGGPDVVWIDNGKDYDAWLFHGQTKRERLSKVRPSVDVGQAGGIFKALSIEPHFSLAYNPNGKARLERWFRTLEGFFKTFQTYTGESPATRPERLAEVLTKPHLIPTFEAVYVRLADHIAGDNANPSHEIDDLVDGTERLSSDQAMARWCTRERVMADPASLDLLLQKWHRPAYVGKNGVSVMLRGVVLHYGQFEQRLMRFKGLRKEDRQPVHVSYDPHDVSTVRVYDANWKLVCVAPMNELGGLHDGSPISEAKVAELNRNKAVYRNAMKRTAERSLTSFLSSEEQLAELVARKPAPPPEAPSSMKIIHTPLDGQGRELQREQFRKAVGAEASTPDAAPARHAGLEALEKLAAVQAADARRRRDDDDDDIDPSALWARLNLEQTP